MPRISQFVVSTAPFRALYRVTDRIVLPGFDGLSLYTVGRFLIKEIRVNKLNVRGAAVTYNFIMAMPPTLLFLCSLIPYLPVRGLQDSIFEILKIITSNNPESYKTLSGIVVDFLNNERRDILSIGILFTLFFSSNGMMGLMRSFDRQSSLYKRRSAFRRRWTAIKLTLLVLLVAIITMAALVLQTRMINHLLEEWLSSATAVIAIKFFSLLLVTLLVFLSICLIYRYGPSLTHRWHFISAGAVFATIMCVVLTIVFFFLVDNVIQYNKVYGSIGTIMAFMVWLFLNTQVILLGFELNISILLGKMAREKNAEKNVPNEHH
jgi:membrane protein